MTEINAMRAIIARIDGVYDDPDLMRYGPLSTSAVSDIRTIAQDALTKNMSPSIRAAITDLLDEEDKNPTSLDALYAKNRLRNLLNKWA